MALTIQNRILDQLVSSDPTFFYLYEPLPILIEESDLAATKIKIDLILESTEDYSLVEELIEYAEYDINPGKGLNVDIMEIIQQAHDSDIWKVGDIAEIPQLPELILSKYSYSLRIYTDLEDFVVGSELRVLPIIGGRRFVEYNPLIGVNFPITEYEQYGIDYQNKWALYPFIETSLQLPSITGPKVVFNVTTPTTGQCAEAGMLYWKSKLGGWMQWGFDLKTVNKKFSQSGNIEVGMMEIAMDKVDTNPYIATDYTGVEYSYSISLKSLTLSKEELEAVSGISESPICYYLASPTSRLELMKLSSATAPLDNLSNGGDFQVSISSISKTGFKTR
jgi:hypothetical protein